MSKPSTDQSVANEPHLQDGFRLTDESEEKAEKILSKRKESVDQKVEHTVWDEPALSGELVKKVPDSAVTYTKWLKDKIENTSGVKSWYMTFLLTLAAGPWAVLGAFMLAFQGHSGFGSVAVVIFGPIIEEMLKISSALITIEKRPYLFKSPRQIFLCCVFSGVVFAFIENIIYLNIYIRNPTPLLVIWRWTVCVLLHSGCTVVSSVGLIKIWSTSMETHTRPRLPHMAKYVIAACVIHGTYNFIGILISPFFK
jgi:hypothetical protein